MINFEEEENNFQCTLKIYFFVVDNHGCTVQGGSTCLGLKIQGVPDLGDPRWSRILGVPAAGRTEHESVNGVTLPVGWTLKAPVGFH